MIPLERHRDLLARIEIERERRLAQGAEAAGAACRRALAEARGTARRQARSAFDELRARAEGEERAARAELESARRARRFVAEDLLAERGLALLGDALRRRWRDRAARRLWIAAALAAAARLLPAGDRRVTVAHGIDADELDALRARGAVRVEAGLDAGLHIEWRIDSSGAVVDASLAGLLRDRRGLHSAILAEVAEEAGT